MLRLSRPFWHVVNRSITWLFNYSIQMEFFFLHFFKLKTSSPLLPNFWPKFEKSIIVLHLILRLMKTKLPQVGKKMSPVERMIQPLSQMENEEWQQYYIVDSETEECFYGAFFFCLYRLVFLWSLQEIQITKTKRLPKLIA